MQALEDLYVHYDETVRNAAGGIVQFSYGDDGLDPVVMEGKDGKPIDFEKLLAKVRHCQCTADMLCLDYKTVEQVVGSAGSQTCLLLDCCPHP